MKIHIFKTSKSIYQMAQCNIAEDLYLQHTTVRTSHLTASLYDITEQNI